MKRSVRAIPVVLAALSLAATAWAGGSMCSGKSEGASKQTAAGSHCAMGTTMTDAGAHCMGGASAQGKEQCTIGAQSAVMSFAVPSAECDACVRIIQKAALAQKGVQCAHVNLDTHTAYVVTDKNVDQRKISKAIVAAGYRCTFKAQGPQVRAELMKAMASGEPNSCPAMKGKAKDKV
jgi:copper chaperone CopZ